MLAHRPCPMCNIHFYKRENKKRWREKTALWLPEMGNILENLVRLCVCVCVFFLAFQIKKSLK